MRLLALMSILLLAACKPNFDERYGKAEKDIRTQASGVDSELAKQPASAPSAAPVPSSSPSASKSPPAR